MRRLFSFVLVLAACSGPEPSPPPPRPPAEPPAVGYEVHEWGLIGGAFGDTLSVSGPRGSAPAMPIAKPVLYFHRDGGEGALEIDVSVRVEGGRIVEHWPHMGGPDSGVTWHDVLIGEGSCRGSRYPSLAEAPCLGIADCESATLATVETEDSDCAYWPRPPDGDGPTQAWNHLFYRGSLTRAPALPLSLEVLADGSLRVTSSREPVVGRLIRVRRAHGAPGVDDGVTIASPPARNASVVLAAPAAPLADGAEALAGSLRDAGLTEPEVLAFRRAWDEAIFGAEALSVRHGPASTIVAAPLPGPTTTLLYVLPRSSADAIAPLTFDPPPTAVRRAIVMWIDEARAP